MYKNFNPPQSKKNKKGKVQKWLERKPKFSFSVWTLKCRACGNTQLCWNEDDNQDEVLQEAELDVIDRIGATLKEMRELQSHEWSVMYKALQDSAEKNAADGSGMPKEGSSMPKDGACKEAE